MPPHPTPLPLRGQLLVRLVAGICGAGGLGLLTWALARQSMDPAMRLTSVGAGLGLVASAVLCWWLSLRLVALHATARAAQDAAQRATNQLCATLDILPDGLAIYDADDRLVLCNPRYREVGPGTMMAVEYGTRFEDVLRRAAESGHIVAARQDTNAWLADRMARHRSPGQPEVQEVEGDRWMLITERLQEGGHGGATRRHYGRGAQGAGAQAGPARRRTCRAQSARSRQCHARRAGHLRRTRPAGAVQ